ncbi:DinB family protein [Micromonospora rifamycinica]|uniref:mycothiol transferase n=1 Tax=Micromonospora rifamycinica TaxID=291594 RepID=UPI002E292F97|nr:DinB family protein [Micromonospora rifamycinica]
MNVDDLLTEAYGQLPDLVRAAVDGLSPDELCRAPGEGANPVGWLVWHLTRIQDQQVAELSGADQVWVTGDWAARFGLPADPADTGFGHTPEQVAAVRPQSAEALVGYHGAVAERTRGFLAGLRPADLDRVVDEHWDPPVTLGVRLVSVVSDDLQHVGQAAYLRGLLRP